MNKENNNNVYETVCDGKDMNFAISELRTQVVRGAVVGRRYRIVVELLPEVTVEDCLLAAVKSGNMVKETEDKYHWVQDVTFGEKALWVETVANLTGLRKKWKWAEQLFGERNIKQELSRAKKNNSAIAFVKGILPRMLNE